MIVLLYRMMLLMPRVSIARRVQSRAILLPEASSLKRVLVLANNILCSGMQSPGHCPLPSDTVFESPPRGDLGGRQQLVIYGYCSSSWGWTIFIESAAPGLRLASTGSTFEANISKAASFICVSVYSPADTAGVNPAKL